MQWYLSCFLNVRYFGCDESNDSSEIDPSWIVYGILYNGLDANVIPRCLKSWMILKLTVCLLGLSMIELSCIRILVNDHKLFWSCWSLMRVLVPNRSEELSLLVKFVIWCCSWISHMLRILYNWGWSKVLVGIVRLSLALLFTSPIWLVRILLHVCWLRTMLWRRYSIVGIMTVLIIYHACVSVICLVLAIW